MCLYEAPLRPIYPFVLRVSPFSMFIFKISYSIDESMGQLQREMLQMYVSPIYKPFTIHGLTY